jgi:hypothetical protein
VMMVVIASIVAIRPGRSDLDRGRVRSR